jgi:hypothetical protein
MAVQNEKAEPYQKKPLPVLEFTKPTSDMILFVLAGRHF